jgi:hypothetical protein
MRVLVLVVGIGTLVACHFGQSTERKRPNASPEVTAVAQRHSETESVRSAQPSEHSQAAAGSDALDEDCKAFLTGMGMRIAVSPEDDRLTSPVSAHMAKTRLPTPQNRRFLVSARSGHWVVCAVDIEALCHGKRPEFDTYHVGEKDGKMQILFIEAGI